MNPERGRRGSAAIFIFFVLVLMPLVTFLASFAHRQARSTMADSKLKEARQMTRATVTDFMNQVADYYQEHYTDLWLQREAVGESFQRGSANFNFNLVDRVTCRQGRFIPIEITARGGGPRSRRRKAEAVVHFRNDHLDHGNYHPGDLTVAPGSPYDGGLLVRSYIDGNLTVETGATIDFGGRSNVRGNFVNRGTVRFLNDGVRINVAGSSQTIGGAYWYDSSVNESGVWISTDGLTQVMAQRIQPQVFPNFDMGFGGYQLSRYSDFPSAEVTTDANWRILYNTAVNRTQIVDTGTGAVVHDVMPGSTSTIVVVRGADLTLTAEGGFMTDPCTWGSVWGQIMIVAWAPAGQPGGNVTINGNIAFVRDPAHLTNTNNRSAPGPRRGLAVLASGTITFQDPRGFTGLGLNGGMYVGSYIALQGIRIAFTPGPTPPTAVVFMANVLGGLLETPPGTRVEFRTTNFSRMYPPPRFPERPDIVTLRYTSD